MPKRQHVTEASGLFPSRRSEKPKAPYPQKFLYRMKAATAKAAVKRAQANPFKVELDETRLSATKRWLEKLLYRGPVYGHDVYAIGAEAGVPYQLLERANEELGVEYVNLNMGPRSCWSLWAWRLPNLDEINEEDDDDEAEE